MKTILRQAGLFFPFFAGVYFLFYIISSPWAPENEYVDAWRKGSTIDDYFRTLTLDASRLQRSSKPKLIMLGGSTTGLGFRPQQLQPLFPDYEIANLAVAGGSALEVRQVMEMVQMLLPEDVLQESVFAVGIVCYTLTAIPRISENSVNHYLVESGLYEWEGDNVRPIVWAHKMDLLVRLLRPYFSLKHALQKHGSAANRSYTQECVTRLFQKIRGEEPKGANSTRLLTGHLPECHAPTEEDKRDFIGRFDSVSGLASESGFDEILAMCRLVEERGGFLILVDVPLAEWHIELSPVHDVFDQRKMVCLEEALKYPNVRYINLQEIPRFSDDSRFLDGMHPCEEVTETWSLALREYWPFDR